MRSKKYILKSKSSTKFKKLKFAKFINLYCKTHFLDGIEFDICYDTDFGSFFISLKTVQIHFSDVKTSKMTNEKKIRCQNIKEKQESDLWINISFKNKITEKDFVIINEKFHIMKNLSCFIIIDTDFMKFFNIKFIWSQRDEQNAVLIQNEHRVEVTVIKTDSVKIRMTTTFILKIILPIKIKFKSQSKIRKIDVYVTETRILKNDQKINVSIKHKLLAFETYLFESIRKKNDVLKNYLSTANSLTTKLMNFISVTNLNEKSTKIRKKQLLKHLRYQKISDINDVAIVNFNYINVFMSKQIKEKIESKNSFIIDSKSIKAVADSNINEHWKKKYRKKINEIFKKYKVLFKSKLKRFTNDIKMFIFFKNEKNILKLKQISYSMSIKNKKAMNEILNSLVKNDKIQKISLKTVLSIASFAFVVWKNEESRIIIDLKRINTKLYSDAYSLFKQDTILFFLKNSEVFSFINLIKRFFQQNTKSRD